MNCNRLVLVAACAAGMVNGAVAAFGQQLSPSPSLGKVPVEVVQSDVPRSASMCRLGQVATEDNVQTAVGVKDSTPTSHRAESNLGEACCRSPGAAPVVNSRGESLAAMPSRSIHLATSVASLPTCRSGSLGTTAASSANAGRSLDCDSGLPGCSIAQQPFIQVRVIQ
jgi:hypothetical protein